MTGDEIIEIYRCDDRWGDPYLYETLDISREDRLKDFLDATYIVYPEQIEEWNEREYGYHIFEKNKFKNTYRGYFGRY